MTDSSEITDMPPDAPEGISLNARISREMAAVMKRFYGKGPLSTKSYLMDDLLLVVMRGGTTIAEQTMIEAGREDAVREFRQRFENEMTERLTTTIERLTGRKVVNYQSQILIDPDMSVEIFVFDQPLASEAPKREAGGVAGDEVG